MGSAVLERRLALERSAAGGRRKGDHINLKARKLAVLWGVQPVMSTSASGLLRFFALTFAITWGLQVPAVLAQEGWLPGDPRGYLPFAGLGMLGPSIAAFLVVRHQGSGLRSFLRQTFSVRGLRPHWLLIGALLPAVMLSAGLWVMGELGRTGPISYTPTLGAALGDRKSVV